MKESVKWIKTEDLSFHTLIWTPERSSIKGVFYLVHGSVEHAMRYKEFAQALTEQGYVVIAPDLRGHGQTALRNQTLGHFSNAPMGWHLCVHDLKLIYDEIRLWYPELPIVLFGHSMGSYLVRTLVKEYPVQLQGLILSGTGAFANGIGDVGIWLAKLTIQLKGYAYPSRFLTDLVYGSLNKKIGQTVTAFDFLSRDAEEVKRYIDDPLCGYVCSAEFIHEMLVGTKQANQQELFNLKADAFPLLIISGDKDPVADKNSRGIKAVVRSYEAHLENVTFKLYKDARHELLNELNKEEVTSDILTWLSSLT